MIVQELVARLGLEVDESVFAKAEAIIDHLGKGLLGVGAALGAYAAGMQALMVSTAGAANEARRAALITGTTTDAIQELHFAAEATGASTGQLDHALVRMSRVAYEASQGSAAAAESLRALGVSATEARSMKPDELFARLADKISKLPDQASKAALAQKVFGRGMTELLPLLSRGAEGLAELRGEAEEYGTVISQKYIAAAFEWKVANHLLEASFEGLRNEIAGPLLEGAGALSRALATFIKENRVLIATVIRTPFEWMRKSLKFVADNLYLVKVALAIVAGYLIQSFGPAVLLGAVASVQAAWAATVAWTSALTLAALAEAAVAAGAVLMQVAIVAGIAAIILLIDDFAGYMSGKDSVTGRFVAAWRGIYAEITRTGSTFAKDQPILAFFMNLTDNILNAKKSMLQLISGLNRLLLIGGQFAILPGAVLSAIGLGARYKEYRERQKEDAAEANIHPTYSPLAPLLSSLKGGATFDNGMWSDAASSPSGSVANNTTRNAPTFAPQINITTQPGASGQEIGQSINNALDSWWTGTLQQSIPASP